MEAISFALAIPDSRFDSKEESENLLNNIDKNRMPECSVSFNFIDDEENEIVFKRYLDKSFESIFFLNKRKVSKKEYIEKLNSYNILVNSRNFIIYQGEVQSISAGSPEQLTELFEQVSGSSALREEYDRLLEIKNEKKAVIDSSMKQKYQLVKEKNQVIDDDSNGYLKFLYILIIFFLNDFY